MYNYFKLFIAALLVSVCVISCDNSELFSKLEITEITGTSAKFNYSCYHRYGWNTGVCLSTSPNPTTANYVERDIDGAIDNLTPNTTYYVRVYMKRGSSTYYSEQVSFKTKP